METWLAESIYTRDDHVTFKGIKYRAKWWTQNEIPEENTFEWSACIACNYQVKQSFIRL